MPLLARKIFSCCKPPTDIKPDESIYVIPHTKEQFKSKEEYEKRLHLYKSKIWTCRSTGHVSLTHEEAWNSEKVVLKTLKEQFSPCYDKPVLQLVHHSTKSLDQLVDEAWVLLQQVLVVGERVVLKVKSGGKSMKAIVVKVDPAGVESNPTSNCSSPSSDKENSERDDNSASPRKWVPPKLLPYKYSIRFEGEDSVIHSVPVSDLGRGDKPPSKELLRLFIRTYAIRAGQTASSPWIVDDAQVRKLDLQSKFASFLLSPVKWKSDDINKRINENFDKKVSPTKSCPRIKTKLDAKEEKRKENVSKLVNKLQEKSEKAEKRVREREELKAKKQAEKIAKKLEAKEKAKAAKVELIELGSSDDSSDEEGSGADSDSSDSDTPLIVVKNQMMPKKNSLTPKKSSSVNLNKSGLTQIKKSGEKLVNGEKVKKKKVDPSKTKLKRDTSLADLKKKLKSQGKDISLADLKKKLKAKKILEKSKDKKKKGQDPKQLTLFDLTKKKGMNTPQKSLSVSLMKTPTKDGQKTPEMKKRPMSPPKTPAIVFKIRQAIKKDEKHMIGTYCMQAAKILNSEQRARLPSDVKEQVIKKYNLIQERHKLALMGETEKKEYLAKQAAERKERMKQQMKERHKKLRKRFEDTTLELKPLPGPKLVPTPESLPNECFGDVAMVTEFIANYAGLLMPDDEYPIYTDAVMKALATGKDGFVYLSRVLTVLLQTLLQDGIAEDYQDLKVPLTDIPVNPCTTSELVRLCLRKQDVDDANSDNSDEDLVNEDDEVPDELIQLLETQELYQLDTVQKLQILKGLCLRIMGTYSVQDYMEEKQQESSRLWREKHAHWKEEKEKRKTEGPVKKEVNQAPVKKEEKDGKEKDKSADKANSLLLTHFYGKKDGDNAPSPGNSETPIDIDETDADLASVVKRRRVTAAQAQEERKQKEKEDRIRREKEMEIQKQQKEREQFEKNFTEGVYLAKVTQRQAPIGTDRNHSRYWVFSDVTPGLFVEKGWASEEIEYSVRPDDDVDSGLSSDSSDDESGAEDADGAPATAAAKKNKIQKVKKCVDTTFPHVGQNLWFTYDSMKDVDGLIESLHPQGSRESVLKAELKKKYQDISSAVFKFKRSNKELRDCNGDEEMIEGFKKELLQTEMRLRHGGLGGVMDFATFETRLETATSIEPLAECLLEVQENVLDKFRDGIFAQKPNKKKEVKDENESDDEDEDICIMAPGIITWRNAVKTSGTFSRLHVLLGILDSCIRWEKSSENAKCKICRKKGEEDRMLLCDDCNNAFHMFCLRPALTEVPPGDWHCQSCAPQYRKRVRDVPGRYKEYSQDVDSEDDEKVKTAKTKSLVHEEACVECGGDEHLIPCAECPSVYHLECHDPPLRHPPRGRWVCNDCKNGITRKTRRGSQRAARKVNRGAAKRKRKEESSDEEDSEEDSEEEGRKKPAKKKPAKRGRPPGRPAKQKKNLKEESSDEEDDDDEESEEEEEEDEAPPRKAARTSKQQAGPKKGRKGKESTGSPKGRPKGKKTTSSPEITYDTKPKTSRRAPSDLSVAESIIDQMMKCKDAWPFYDLVLKRDVPDYYEIIKQPISFQKIKDRLNCLVYGCPQEVIDAVALLFRNAAQYNKTDSEIWELMEKSEKHFIDLLAKNLPMYVYNRNMSNGLGEHTDSPDGRRSRKSK